jgi:hypothetical protein
MSMKLRKKDRIRLEGLAADLQRGINFILDPNTAIMRKSNLSSTDMFTAPYYQGERYSKIAKELGNEFVVALSALRQLKQALAEPEVTPKQGT